MNAARKAAAPLLDRARQILQPTIFPPGLPSVDPIECVSWAALKARVLQLADGRPITCLRGTAAYPDFDPFPCMTVRAGGEYLCTVADRWPDEGTRARAKLELEGLA